jgi:hypothetical protein
LKTVSQGLFVFAGLLASPAPTKLEQAQLTPDKPVDSRIVRLKRFLQERDCPISRFASDFIEAADRFDLDWRLLPSISYVESGGGKEYRGNNIFGWGNGLQVFPSIRAGIKLVASRLAHSNLYRDKSLDEILKTYNPDVTYGARVKAVMVRLGKDQAYVAPESD